MGFLDRWRAGTGGTPGRFPPDMAARMDEIGRREVGRGGGLDQAVDVEPFLADLQADPDGFVEDLARLALREGGWTAFGAQRWVSAVYPAAMSRRSMGRVVDVGVAWVIAQGYGRGALRGYERDHAPGDADL